MKLVWIKGAGDLASGIALRLMHSGFRIMMTDLPEPTSVRRTVCFSEAIRLGRCRVEDVCAVRANDVSTIRNLLGSAQQPQTAIPVIPDPEGTLAASFHPDVIVDAIIAKKNLGTKITDAPIVIGVGPGFTAGSDCHAVIETKRGHTLGRVIRDGSAIPNTGIPGNIGGFAAERVFRASADGIFHPENDFGDLVHPNDEIAYVETSSGNVPVYAAINGMIRGMLPDGLPVTKGMKAGDIDPRGASVDYRTVSDKALAIAGGVLEAILSSAKSTSEDHCINNLDICTSD